MPQDFIYTKEYNHWPIQKSGVCKFSISSVRLQKSNKKKKTRRQNADEHTEIGIGKIFVVEMTGEPMASR